MNQHQEALVAVQGQRLTTLENVVYELVDVQKGVAKTQQDIGKTMALLQQSYVQFTESFYQNDAPKIKELWDTQSNRKVAGYVITAICSLMVGGAAVGGFIYMLLNHTGRNQ